MKFTAIVLGLAISSAAFSATILNGVTLTGLPTASKSYSNTTGSAAGVASMKSDMLFACSTDKANTENFLVRNGFKVIASEKCAVKIQDNTDVICDQGGCSGDGLIHLNASFTVTFK